jgi:hypothetical protein
MKILRTNIKPFSSIDPTHIDLQKLNSVFEHVPHFGIYRRRIRNLVSETHYGRRELQDVLQLTQDLISLSTRTNLEVSFDLLKKDLSGRIGEFELRPDEIIFEGRVVENLVQQAIAGHSLIAFNLHVLLRLDDRIRQDHAADELHEGLSARLRHLCQLQMQTQRKKKDVQQQVVSEYILAHSASLMKDLKKISNLSLSSDVRLSVNRHRDHVISLMKEEFDAFDLRISDSLIFLSQLNKLLSSSRAYENKCRVALERMSRELLGLTFLLSGTEKTIEDESLKSFALENIKLNLFFALLLLPHSEVFRGKYATAVEGRLMQLSHYANYIKDIDFESVTVLSFPEDSTLGFEGLPPFKGQKVIDLVRMINAQETNVKKSSNLHWNLYLQIELYLRNHLKNQRELESIIAMKKLLVYQMLQRYTSRSVQSLKNIRAAVLGVEGRETDTIYLPPDVILILRDVCHCFSQLLQNGNKKVFELYRNDANPFSYRQKERLPKGVYRRRTEGSIRQAKDSDQAPVGEQLESLLNVLCDSCERNLERNVASQQLDKIIKENAPYDGGLLDILDDPERLRKLMESPIIKNQSLNRKRLVQLLNLTRSILSS